MILPRTPARRLLECRAQLRDAACDLPSGIETDSGDVSSPTSGSYDAHRSLSARSNQRTA